jgi:hypothetical protein
MTSGARYSAVPQNVLVVSVPAPGIPFGRSLSRLGDWGTPLAKNSPHVPFGVEGAVMALNQRGRS